MPASVPGRLRVLRLAAGALSSSSCSSFSSAFRFLLFAAAVLAGASAAAAAAAFTAGTAAFLAAAAFFAGAATFLEGAAAFFAAAASFFAAAASFFAAFFAAGVSQDGWAFLSCPRAGWVSMLPWESLRNAVWTPGSRTHGDSLLLLLRLLLLLCSAAAELPLLALLRRRVGTYRPAICNQPAPNSDESTA